MKIDEETRLEYEIQRKIEYYTMKAITKEEIDQIMEDYENEYGNEPFYVSYEGEEYYNKDFAEVDYRVIEKSEDLPF